MSGTPTPNDQPTPYQQPVEAVLASLATDAQHRLSEAEAQARLVRYGRNELAAEEPVPRWRRFLAQFGDALERSGQRHHSLDGETEGSAPGLNACREHKVPCAWGYWRLALP
jgi:hypothetical protein